MEKEKQLDIRDFTLKVFFKGISDSPNSIYSLDRHKKLFSSKVINS